MKKGFFIYLGILMSISTFSQAIETSYASESPNFSVKSITVEDGLPQGFINGIIQDKRGFIWMGTRDGLARYDGRSVKVFRSIINDSNSLAANVISTIYADKENNIWIIYENTEMDIFNPLTEKIRHISRELAFAWMHKYPIGYPARFVQDSKQGFWIISDDGTLRRFSFKEPVPLVIHLPEGVPAYAVKEDKGIIWVLTSTALFNFEGVSSHKVSTLPKPFNATASDFYKAIGTMVRDSHNDWIIGGDGYVQIYNVPTDSWQLKNTGHRVNRFFTVSGDGTVYFNSDENLCRLNADHTISVVWENQSAGFVSMMTDRSDVLWIGTNTFGARLINLSSRGFHSFSYRNGFINDVLIQLQPLPVKLTGSQYIDPYNSRTALDRTGNLWGINLPAEEVNGQKCYVYNFPTITRLTPGKANIIPFETNTGDIRVIENLAFDYQNNCWATTYTNELSRVDLKAKKIIPVLSLPLFGQNFNHTPAYLAAFGKKLCIVFSNALEIYDIPTGKTTIYQEQVAFKNTNLLMAVADPDKDEVVWIASMGNGLIRFDTKTGSLESFTEKEGIPSNTVYAIIADKHGLLWCSSNKGIFRFNPKDNSLISFTAKDGLQGEEFNRYHFLELPEGQIAFGGTRGWTVFYPDSIQNDRFQPSVAVTQILVNNAPLNQLPHWKDSAVANLTSLVLPHNQNFITFYFSGLQFNQTEKLQYRYKLEGVDNDWVKSGNLNMATYTNLPHGHYIFKVSCTNTSGIWSKKTETMQLMILPSWWETWWARVAFAGILFTIAVTFYRNHISIIRTRQEVILNQKEKEQLREVDEMKSRFFSNITHEFRTPLSLIVAPLEELIKETNLSASGKYKLSLIQNNARQLTRLINQLLDMSKLEAGNMKILLSRGDLNLFIADCIQSFEPLAAAKHQQLHYESEAAKGECLFDAGKFEKIIFNLLSNAVKFTPEYGSIKVALNIGPGPADGYQLLLKVSDTGIGIPADKMSRIFERFYQVDETSTRMYDGTGIGLALVKELTGLMGGSIKVESVTGKGTAFELVVPVQLATDAQMPGWKRSLSYELPNDTSIGTTQEVFLGHNPKSLILIVEDNKELSGFIADTLATNYKVLTAENGREGLKIAREELPDIIISDVMMPEMNGYEFCRFIKGDIKTSHIAFIILTAKASHDSVMEGLMQSADDYLTKPFHMDELGLRIRNILDHQEKIRRYHNAQFTLPGLVINTHTEENEFLQNLYTVIEENIDDAGLGVEKLALLMTVGVRTLNRKLNVLAGLSAHEIIMQYRLKRAADLIKKGHKISDIAYSVGFSTPSYFSASFKAFYGHTPSHYSVKTE